MARRFLPVILPGALLLRVRRGARRAPRPVSRARDVLRGALGARVPRAAGAPVRARGRGRCSEHVEYAGIIPQLEQLAGAHRRRRPADRGVARRVGHARARRCRSPTSTRATCCSCARACRTRRRSRRSSTGPDAALRARAVHGRRRHRSALARWDVAPVAGERFQVPEYETQPERLSARRRGGRNSTTASTSSCRLAPAPRHDWTLDVGTQDDLNVLRFHAKETADGRSFRWSRDTSYVSLAGAAGDARAITLWMDDGGRPAAAPPARGDGVAAARFEPATAERRPAARHRARSRGLQAVHVRDSAGRWPPRQRPAVSRSG